MKAAMLDLTNAQRRVADTMGFEIWDMVAVVAEAVRHELWCASAGEAVSGAMSSMRIGAKLARRFAAVAEAPIDTQSVLRLLEEQGDAYHLGNGMWVGTPARLVALPSPQVYLVVGGMPSDVIAAELDVKVRTGKGVTRWADAGDTTRAIAADSSRAQLWDAWLGWPPPDAMHWAASQLSLAQSSLLSRNEAAEGLQVYLRGRWQGPPSGTHGSLLCREPTGSGGRNKRYFIGRLEDTASGTECPHEAAVEKVDVSRLMYGMDALDARARRIEITAGGAADTVAVRFPKALPRPELRAMRVLSGAHRRVDDERFHRRFLVPVAVVEVARHLARRLALVVSDSGGDAL